MIAPYEFCIALQQHGINFCTGVPDSLLQHFCAAASVCFAERYLIAANEGNAIGIAAGQYLATQKPSVVFLQNSGLGNTINPLLSLADPQVYRIPMLLCIGWRGEPGVPDEPQHLAQGAYTPALLEAMGIPPLVLTDDYDNILEQCMERLAREAIAAILVRKNTFVPYPFALPEPKQTITREMALRLILDALDTTDIVVSTTGKTSREVFELREAAGSGHAHDFLTVGSMGHSSSIALGISLATDRTVYCIDGDGAFLMHMGACAVNAAKANENFKYIVLNNGAHESVGGQPTVGFTCNIAEILHGCGFSRVLHATNEAEISDAVVQLKACGKAALVIDTRQGSRSNLGRPTCSPLENRAQLMEELQQCKR